MQLESQKCMWFVYIDFKLQEFKNYISKRLSFEIFAIRKTALNEISSLCAFIMWIVPMSV